MKRFSRLTLLALAFCVMLGFSAFQSYAAEITLDNFDYVAYADTYPDLKEAYGYDKQKLYEHYINNGQKEGREAKTLDGEVVSSDATPVTGNPGTLTLTVTRSSLLPQQYFDAAYYAEHNPDVVAAFGNNAKKMYAHYVNNGEKEGRAAFSTNDQINAKLLAYDVLKSSVNDGMTAEEKIRVVHDYLVNYADYDVDNYYAGRIPNRSYHMEGIMLYQRAVCQGYAETFDYMMGLLGIECTICTGRAYNGQSTGSHAWNRVKLGDQYYYIDATWDDPVGGWGPNYKFYMISQEQMAYDHFQSGSYDVAIN
ncbi:MAG: hypothetical protein K6A92_04780 [Lachnospiraceae bacterium]|nr:hypothetical protein [Lachnospiraceae bacterium]